MSHPSSMLDPEYLRHSQYRDNRQLAKRMALHTRFSTNPQSWFEWLFAQMDFPDHPHVLEIGCGTGALWAENRQRLPNGMSLTITDLSPGMLESAQRTLNEAGIAHTALVADARYLPFDPGIFDVVIANHVLHHVPDLQLAIAEIRQVLKPEGTLYAATNGLPHMEELFALMPESGSPSRAVIDHFNLEHGGKTLETSFSRAERRDFANDLRVTAVQPVIDYLESTQDATVLAADVIERIRQTIESIIAKQGAFRIRKATGVFVAQQ